MRLFPFSLAILRKYTTGIDGYQKTLPFDLIIPAIDELMELKKSISSMQEQGPVLSMTSGSESVSYSQAVLNSSYQKEFIDLIITTYLAGLKDENGVNILYRGVYPNV